MGEMKNKQQQTCSNTISINCIDNLHKKNPNAQTLDIST